MSFPSMPPLPIDLLNREAFSAMSAQRTAQAAVVSSQLDQIRQNPADLAGNLALLQQARDAANAIGYAQGAALANQIGQVQQTWQTGGYTPPVDQWLSTLSTQAARPVAGVLASGQASQWNAAATAANRTTDTSAWDLLTRGTGQAPTPAATTTVPDWQGIVDLWNGTGRPTPTPTSQPDLMHIFGGQTGSDAFTSLLNLPAVGSGTPGAPLNDVFQPSLGALGALGTVVSGGGGGHTSPVAAARQQLGQRYVWGGESRAEGGFDCSGLLQWAWHQAGVSLPRTTWQQVTQGSRVGWGGMRPGDCIYFDMNGGSRDANHCGMYIGNGKMIAASTGQGKVVVQDLNAFWRDRFVDARRFG